MCKGLLRLLPLLMWAIGLGFAVVSPASGADPTAIRDILDEPSVYHLRQVVLQGRVRNVQPLDPYKLPAGTTSVFITIHDGTGWNDTPVVP